MGRRRKNGHLFGLGHHLRNHPVADVPRLAAIGAALGKALYPHLTPEGEKIELMLRDAISSRQGFARVIERDGELAAAGGALMIEVLADLLREAVPAYARCSSVSTRMRNWLSNYWRPSSPQRIFVHIELSFFATLDIAPDSLRVSSPSSTSSSSISRSRCVICSSMLRLSLFSVAD